MQSANKLANLFLHPVFLFIFIVTVSAVTNSMAKDSGKRLNLEQRVSCQMVIENIRWSHRIWPAENKSAKPALSAILSDTEIHSHVEDNLRMEIALQELYGISIDNPMLQAELDRMAAHTRAPKRLQELFAALGNDPVVLGECLARPILVRQKFEKQCATNSHYQGNMQQEKDFDSWWQPQTEEWPFYDALMDISSIQPALSRPKISGRMMEIKTDSSGKILANTWTATGDTAIAPSERNNHTAVWTGTEMIIWGGNVQGYDVHTNTGGRYDPATDSWKTTRVNVYTPPATVGHSAIWTGTEMIIWGGDNNPPDGQAFTQKGGRYNPVTNSWQTTSLSNAPSGRMEHSAVWTGTKMIVWGGFNEIHYSSGSPTYMYHNDGELYDPENDTWEAMTHDNLPAERMWHSTVWTGTEMIVWGGFNATDFNLDDGGRYNPVTDTWTTIPAVSIPGEPSPPSERRDHSAVWTGSVMIIWGGIHGSASVADGGQYNPNTGRWMPTSTENAPITRATHTSVWTGTEMIVCGGAISEGGSLKSCGRYEPVNDIWTTTAEMSAERSKHSAVWTGTEMIVWGGALLNSGERYDPATGSWTATSYTNPPADRTKHSAVWTGSEMIVWGGEGSSSDYLDSGAIYNPVIDHWDRTSTQSAPEARHSHTAVWTGIEMIIWGGVNKVAPYILSDGKRYKPATNSWLSVAPAGEPVPRFGHSAVWTGEKMIIWGGGGPGTVRFDGGLYDPQENSWEATPSTTTLPHPRSGHSTLWTGSEMIVWGGIDGSGSYLNSGERFKPATGKWTAVTEPGAPAGRNGHSAVWTNKEMIIWGGSAGSNSYFNNGGRYDPATDTWTGVSTDGAPTKRTTHTAVWTGRDLIVWGGEDSSGTDLDSGGRYDPASNSWTETSLTNAPSPRTFHTAIWTGKAMVVWGGDNNGTPLGSGGIYYPYIDPVIKFPWNMFLPAITSKP